MTLAFVLTMPSNNSWNGRWSGDERVHCVLENFRGKKQEAKAAEIVAKSPYFYEFGDGWCAKIEVKQVDRAEAAKLRRKSAGFNGYDWMVRTIVYYGEIIAESDLPKAASTT